MGEVVECRIMVQGNVDSPRFKAACANAARSLALKGTINSLGAGSAEVVVQGRKEATQAFAGKLGGMEADTVNVLQTIPINQAKQGYLNFNA
ncbi:MAG: acylphosphatase [Candidatus Micrarchaeota archaeon]